jgi:hypothetical protein
MGRIRSEERRAVSGEWTARRSSIIPHRSTIMALWLMLLAAPGGFAQDWATKMFDHTSHDFGTVARGAKVEHTFTVENIYEEDMVISDVRVSCGCTVPRISKRLLKTWEKAQIVAQLDTRGFFGRKDATLTVVFGGEFPAEVQLHVHAYIRSDIVVQPGSVQFGSVAEGTGAVEKVTISYAGRPDWEIRKVETDNPHLEAEAVKAAQSPLGHATYELVVKLKSDAPAGYIRDYLILVTNDRRTQYSRVPLAVEGVVVPAVTVRPWPLLLGVVSTGQNVTGQLVVQGRKPFRIVKVECSDARLTCALPQGEEEKPLYLLPVTFKAGDETGNLSATIRIQTSLSSGKPLEVPVNVRVTRPAPASRQSPTIKVQ